MTKREQAGHFLADAEALGCTPALRGEWVEWRPPLPTEMLLRALPLGNEIAAILREAEEGA